MYMYMSLYMYICKSIWTTPRQAPFNSIRCGIESFNNSSRGCSINMISNISTNSNASNASNANINGNAAAATTITILFRLRSTVARHLL